MEAHEHGEACVRSGGEGVTVSTWRRIAGMQAGGNGVDESAARANGGCVASAPARQRDAGKAACGAWEHCEKEQVCARTSEPHLCLLHANGVGWRASASGLRLARRNPCGGALAGVRAALMRQGDAVERTVLAGAV